MRSQTDVSDVKDVGFKIFRRHEAKNLEILDVTGLTEISQRGMNDLQEAGNGGGVEVLEVLDVPGFSITYAWFKSGFPLPRHSHIGDCAYYVVAGSLRLGTETLEKGDGFFVPGGTPYTYVPGAEGVEVLEFRHGACSDIHVLANNQAYWDKARAAVVGSVERWDSELRPCV